MLRSLLRGYWPLGFDVPWNPMLFFDVLYQVEILQVSISLMTAVIATPVCMVLAIL